MKKMIQYMKNLWKEMKENQEIYREYLIQYSYPCYY